MVRFAESQVDIRNNLTRRITRRDGAGGTVAANVENVPLADFVAAAALDFHLAAGAADAVGQGQPVAEAGRDIDDEPHDPVAPDLGADER